MTMADMMTFPDTWEEYEKLYGFNDSEEVYTNGSRLIPSFRVRQWLDHIAHLESKRQATVSSDCISRQDAICLAEQGQIQGFEWQFKKLCDLPSAQPEIIRCKDCKYARLTYDGSCKYCDIWFPDDAEYMDGDYYCASAERKDNE